MKVVQIAKMFPPPFGGVETVVASLAQGFSDRPGIDMEVHSVRMDGMWKYSTRSYSGVPIHEVPTLGTIARTSIAPTLLRQAVRSKPDLLHFHFPYPWIESLQVLSLNKIPYIVSYHGDIGRFKFLYSCYKPLMKSFLNHASRIVVATSNHIDSSSVLRGDLVDKCRIIPYGMDLQPYRTTPNLLAMGLERRAILSNGGPLILFVGRLVLYKGISTLLEAMTQVQATLIIIGEGPLRRDLENETVSLGIADKVKFMGTVPFGDLPSYYHAADLFVLPSDRPEEAFGLVQVEAHAAGLPVVCCALPTGVTKVNLHGISGLVVPLRDSRAMAEAVNQLIGDQEMRTRLGKQAKERAFQEYSIESMCNRYEALYREILPQH